MTIDQPYSNHNGGHIAFGPDGYLFIGMGDGGGAGDPGNRARNINSLLGKMLRIDVNGTTGVAPVPHPAVQPVRRAGPARDEIYSRGLRNPWRWSFDRRTADLWIGDVGQGRYEEIDRSTIDRSGRGRGVDYGWKVMEGRACYSPSTGCSTTGKILPVVAYNHSAGDCSVIGGYVYRGHGGAVARRPLPVRRLLHRPDLVDRRRRASPGRSRPVPGHVADASPRSARTRTASCTSPRPTGPSGTSSRPDAATSAVVDSRNDYRDTLEGHASPSARPSKV